MNLYTKSKWMIFLFIVAVQPVFSNSKISNNVKQDIRNNPKYDYVLSMAKEVMQTGFSAGEGYNEVWIRDFATFMDLACEVREPKEIRDTLLMFFRFQGDDGNIVDGYISTEKAGAGYDYIGKEDIPEYRAHKNTVETDQESSLVQAIYRYVQKTKDISIISEKIFSIPVLKRIELALNFLMTHRYNTKYGLLWGATTADWGDVQPEHSWGVVLDENSHLSIDIYDNAMFLIAIQNYIALERDEEKITHWKSIHKQIKSAIRTHLWDEKHQKFIPHIYLNESPFPADFNENEIFYHGGTAVAILAGVLTKAEIKVSLELMKQNVSASGAASIGLTLYPPYPSGYFKNPSMAQPFSYQNGGDWTWFGGRMIHALIQNGFIEEAQRELEPMVQRVIDNKGFYEWYSITNEPRGSGIYRGSAGVLSEAIWMLRDWAEK